MELEETTFVLGQYFNWLERIEEESRHFRNNQQLAFHSERAYWRENGIIEESMKMEFSHPLHAMGL